MRRRVLAEVMTLLLVAGVAGAEPPPPEPRSVTVVGVGRETGAPDLARIQFAVEHQAPSAKAAGEAAAKTAAALLAVLKRDAGPDARVQTAGYHVNPVYGEAERVPPPDRPRRPVVVGYAAVQEVSVETRRIDAVGSLIDAALGAGAARIGSLAFTVADPGPLQERALAKAAADAARQAAAIAGALQVRLGEVLEATTDPGAQPRPERYARMMAADAATATPIEPGDVTSEARLRVTYRIE